MADRTSVRKVAPDGTVTTIAGVAGDRALSGAHDGVGAKARFGFPTGLAADGAGNVYLADQHAIRRITATGVVTTVAGGAEAGTTDGLGAAARFAKPTAVAVDRAGNLYLTDVDFHYLGPFNEPVLTNTIRKITPAGRVTTLAGSMGPPGAVDGSAAQARFSRPYGIAVDGNGNLYVGDCGNHAIRKVTPSGMVSTFAGTAGVGGSADGVGAAARFNCPTGVALDEEGNIYVADSGNATVRKIAPSGAVTTLAGAAGKWVACQAACIGSTASSVTAAKASISQRRRPC